MTRIADFIVKGDAQNALPFNIKEAAKKAVYPIFEKEKEYPKAVFSFEEESREKTDKNGFSYLQIHINNETEKGFTLVNIYGSTAQLEAVLQHKGGTFHCSIEKKFLNLQRFVRVVNLRVLKDFPDGNTKILKIGSTDKIPQGFKVDYNPKYQGGYIAILG